MGDPCRSWWCNCAIEVDTEIEAIDRMEDALDPLDPALARVRGLIGSLELCHHQGGALDRQHCRGDRGGRHPQGAGHSAERPGARGGGALAERLRQGVSRTDVLRAKRKWRFRKSKQVFTRSVGGRVTRT